jgi:LPXTG-site transpeptidase (sortase) family protein
MKHISNILIVCGIVIMCIPFVGRMLLNYSEGTILPSEYTVIEQLTTPSAENTVEKPQNTDDKPDLPTNVSLDEGQATSVSENFENIDVNASTHTDTDINNTITDNNNTVLSTPKPVQKQTILGRIKIEKIRLNEVIVEGVERSNLAAGIGHVPGTAGLGMEGNCVLAGHRNATFKTFFRHLDQLELGDQITIIEGDKEYTYTVNNKSVVEPSEVSVLRSTTGHYDLTLITCTPLYIASHRLVISASMTG